MSARSAASRWPRLPPAPVAVAALALAVLLVYLPTLVSMARIWARSDTFAHGALVLPLAAWLLWRGRAALGSAEPRPSGWGLVALAACLAAWLAGSLVHADVVGQLAVMAMIPALVLLVLGPQVLRTAAFPLFFAVLAVPAGEFLIAPMMTLTANGAAGLLKRSGVPVFQDGLLISIPAGDFQVADACSGVRYLIAAATIGLLFAHLFYRGWKKRLLFMAFAVVLTVMANVLRAYIIVVLAHWSDMRLAAGVDHFIYGWFLFSMLLAALFAVGLRFAEGNPPPAGGDVTRFAGVLAGQPARFALSAACGAALLAAGPVALAALARAADEERLPSWPEPPARVAGAALAGAAAAPPWLREEPGWEAVHLAYRGGPGFEVHLFRGRAGAAGRDVSLLREQLAPEGVLMVEEREVAVASAAGPLAVRQMRLRTGAKDVTVAYWFDVGGQRTANPVTAKIAEMRTIIKGEHKKPALIAVALDSKGLDRPAESLQAIVAELAVAAAPCERSARGPATVCGDS